MKNKNKFTNPAKFYTSNPSNSNQVNQKTNVLKDTTNSLENKSILKNKNTQQSKYQNNNNTKLSIRQSNYGQKNLNKNDNKNDISNHQLSSKKGYLDNNILLSPIQESDMTGNINNFSNISNKNHDSMQQNNMDNTNKSLVNISHNNNITISKNNGNISMNSQNITNFLTQQNTQLNKQINYSLADKFLKYNKNFLNNENLVSREVELSKNKMINNKEVNNQEKSQLDSQLNQQNFVNTNNSNFDQIFHNNSINQHSTRGVEPIKSNNGNKLFTTENTTIDDNKKLGTNNSNRQIVQNITDFMVKDNNGEKDVEQEINNKFYMKKINNTNKSNKDFEKRSVSSQKNPKSKSYNNLIKNLNSINNFDKEKLNQSNILNSGKKGTSVLNKTMYNTNNTNTKYNKTDITCLINIANESKLCEKSRIAKIFRNMVSNKSTYLDIDKNEIFSDNQSNVLEIFLFKYY
jgi:hypothetical protein